jgi:hypothetical protein
MNSLKNCIKPVNQILIVNVRAIVKINLSPHTVAGVGWQRCAGNGAFKAAF